MPIRFTRTTVSNGCSWCGPRLGTVRSAQPTPAQPTARRSPPSASTAASTAASHLVLVGHVAVDGDRGVAQLGGERLGLVVVRGRRSPRARRAPPAPRGGLAEPGGAAATRMRRFRSGPCGAGLYWRAQRGDAQRRTGRRRRCGSASSRSPAASSSRSTASRVNLRADLGAHLLAVGEASTSRSAPSIRTVCAPFARSRISIQRARLVEERHVLEGLGLEVGAEALVEHAQHVAVELRGHARAVVVGGLEHGAVLDQVGADQQPVRRAHQLAQRAQEAGAARGVEVADRAAEEREQRGARRRGCGRGRDSKSPTTPWTARPGYSSASSSAHGSTTVARRRRTARSAAARPAPAIAYSSARVFEAVPEPSSTSSRRTAPTISGRAPVEDLPLGSASGSTRAASVMRSNSSEPRSS